jgi:hypothetical protein
MAAVVAMVAAETVAEATAAHEIFLQGDVQTISH